MCNSRITQLNYQPLLFDIKEESGAQITIGKPDPKNPNDRVITIKVCLFCVVFCIFHEDFSER